MKGLLSAGAPTGLLYAFPLWPPHQATWTLPFSSLHDILGKFPSFLSAVRYLKSPLPLSLIVPPLRLEPLRREPAKEGLGHLVPLTPLLHASSSSAVLGREGWRRAPAFLEPLWTNSLWNLLLLLWPALTSCRGPLLGSGCLPQSPVECHPSDGGV